MQVAEGEHRLTVAARAVQMAWAVILSAIPISRLQAACMRECDSDMCVLLHMFAWVLFVCPCVSYSLLLHARCHCWLQLVLCLVHAVVLLLQKLEWLLHRRL